MTSPGTIAFDMIGTCFSLDKPKQRLTALGAPAYTLQLWFAQTLRDAFALSHAGGYQPLKEMLEAELPRTLTILGVEASTQQRSHVVAAFSELELETGAVETFQHLTQSGWRIVALTNGSAESTNKLLEQAGVKHYFVEVRSCDELQITKPHPKVYQLLQPKAEGDLWLLAAHAWDIAGATRAGLKTAFITLEEGAYLSAYPKPDVIASSLMEAVRQIVGMSR